LSGLRKLIRYRLGPEQGYLYPIERWLKRLKSQQQAKLQQLKSVAYNRAEEFSPNPRNFFDFPLTYLSHHEPLHQPRLQAK
jgi:hypothetical protein